jgi:glyoxylase I family protein
MPIEISTEGLLRDLEMQLLDPDFRRDTSRVLELLADEFTEIGTRGRQYDLVAIVREMSRGRSQEVVVNDWEVREIYPTVMLCTYRTTGPSGRQVLRSSVWVKRSGRWFMSFHQGTPIPDSW